MKFVVLFILALIVVGVAGGAGYLAFVDTGATRTNVEIEIPNDRFKD